MSAKPIRLQLSRRKGFDLQKLSRKMNSLEAVVVSRPSKWGCPYPLKKESEREKVIAKFRSYLRANSKLVKAARQELREKNLACWCRLDLSCHADVWLNVLSKK